MKRLDIFYDKYGREIEKGNILFFENGHKYKVNSEEGVLYINCLSETMPGLRMDKVFPDKVIHEAYIMD